MFRVQGKDLKWEDSMKKLWLVLLVSLCCVKGFAQGATVINKMPAAPVTFQWAYITSDEAKISGFDLVQEAKGAATVETIVQTVTPTARSTTGLKAPALGGAYFYVCRAFFNDMTTGTAVKILSADSNEVQVTVVVLPVPTGATVK